MKRKIHKIFLAVFVSICCFAFSCSDDEPVGTTIPTIVGAKLTIYKNNDRHNNYTLISISSSVINIEKGYTFAMNETYIIDADLIYTGGSVAVKLLAAGVNFDYDSNYIEIDKCLKDEENDTTYYLSGIQPGSSAFKATIDEYEIETTFIFE